MTLQILKEIKLFFEHIFWPQTCPVCGKIAVSFCANCLESVSDPLSPFCLECGGKYGVSCCKNSVPCFALSMHNGVAREFLLKLKYHNVKYIGFFMGRLMAKKTNKPSANLIVPIPLHKKTSREYNQSALLAKGISDEYKIKCDETLLSWRKNRTNQTEQDGLQRASLPLDAIIAKSGIHSKEIILVDDVYTTGGTLRSAKAAVERQGGKVVAAMLWSRRITSVENEVTWESLEEID